MFEECVATASKLTTSVDSAPDSCTSTPVTWVSTSTGTRSPARGPLPISRSERG